MLKVPYVKTNKSCRVACRASGKTANVSHCPLQIPRERRKHQLTGDRPDLNIYFLNKTGPEKYRRFRETEASECESQNSKAGRERSIPTFPAPCHRNQLRVVPETGQTPPNTRTSPWFSLRPRRVYLDVQVTTRS